MKGLERTRMMKPENLTISVQSLAKTFGDREVLREVSFELPPGSILGYLGPNGAGKTTTIRIVLGLIRPDKGKVRVNEWTAGVDSVRINRHLGVALETPALYRSLSVQDNLFYCGRLRGMEAADLAGRCTDLLQRFDLSDVAGLAAGKLSKGMSQKLALARALLHRPRVLILDEPTEGLDPKARRQVKDHILALAREEDCTILLTSHNLSEVEELCSHLVFLRGGRVVEQGRTEELLLKTEHPAVRVGLETNAAASRAESLLGVLPFVDGVRADGCDLIVRMSGGAREVGRLLNRYEIEFLTLGEDHTSLEQYYLSLMAEENQHA